MGRRNEDTAAVAAGAAKGVGRVSPLEGGFDGWRERGFPVQFLGPVLPDEHRILNAA
jgi:rhodanese-related sulfurtransferase